MLKIEMCLGLRENIKIETCLGLRKNFKNWNVSRTQRNR